ncbi:MAG: response regulator [Nitrospirae bacterium]|nr:response regulator [Nitrospirota bacterium]
MKLMNQTRNITGIITCISGMVIALFVIVVPAGFFTVSYQHMAGSLETEAEINAAIISHAIDINLPLDEIGRGELNAVISRRLKQGRGEIRRMFNEKNVAIAESIDKIAPPFISRSADVMKSGTVTGRVEISRSIRPLVVQTAALSLIGVFAGAMIFVTLKILPLRTIQRTEDALRESEERYRDLFDSAGDLIQIINLNGAIAYVNRSWLNVMGYGEGEIRGLSFLNVVHPDERDIFADVFKCLISGDKVESFESRFITRDGKIIIVEGGVDCSFKNGNPAAFRSIFRDITKRKQAEEMLQNTVEDLEFKTREVEDAYVRIETDRNNLRDALNTFSEIIADVERKKGFEKYTYEPQENPLIPVCWEVKNCNYTGCPVYGKRHVRCWQIAGTHCGGVIQGQFAKKFTDCKECEVYKQATAEPIYEIRETFNNMMHILQITHNELITARYIAEESSRLKSEFLANMSHEIRTPMNGIIGMTSLALETELTDEQREYLKNVQESAYALLDIINNILDFSKIESGKLTLDITDFDLRLTVEGVVDTLAPQASEKGLELAYLIQHNIPSLIRGDSGRLRQVLLNLGSNAIKFTPKGEVTITAELMEESADTAMILFTVKDTGVGIPKEKQQTIFEAFVQSDGSTTRMYGGTGLGLTISKKLVNMMGGEIAVDSEQGKGSKFWFSLQFEKQKGEHISDAAKVADLKGTKLLVADDSETNRIILVKMLESVGCEVKSVSSGAEAIKALKDAVRSKKPFNVLLLDMQMPGMNGEHTTIIIRNSLEIKDTAIIIMTSIGSRADVAHLRELGCNGCLIKPIKQSLLLDAVAGVIDTGGAGEKPGVLPGITRRTMIDKKIHDVGILVAEDNPINQKLITAMLKKAGYRVDVAGDGRIALDAIEKNNYDIILMDVQMPEIDGFEVTKIIRSKEKGERHNTIIAMTAHALKGDRERCIEAGMDDYIAKPINPRELFKIIENWIKPGVEKHGEPEIKHTYEESVRKTDITDSPVDIKSAMERFDNDMGFFKAMLDEFLGYVPDQIQAIEDAVKSGNADEVESKGHSIKGAAGMLSADRVSSIALSIESKGHSREISDVPKLLNDLKYEISRLEDFVKILHE